VLRSLTGSGVRSLASTPPTLEELFLRHYQDDADDADGAGGAASQVTEGLMSR
jgi:ABC-2 type transport system ATP-binding protein